MKRRLSAVLLAAGLTVSAFSMGVYAAEAETETTEQVTEAVTEAPAEAAMEEEESELASETGDDAAADTAAVSQEDAIKGLLESQLVQISAWTDDQIDELIDGKDATGAAIAANWKSVKEELGAFVEVTDAELNAEGTEITGHAKYEKISDNIEVTVVYSVNPDTQTASMSWDVDYPMSILMQRAGMNTIMGLAIVFLTLLFLSWLIGRLHIIPDMIEKKTKSSAPAAAPAPAPVAAPAPAEEEDLTDDLELVAVITAAIAASENTSSDGFVVRSIKKANKRNWQRA
ncbi:MAG: OadG family protein [Lachnospiraceae bacterium]|nr:OadG family protein [Lachnospiraceae bacterium]